MQQQQERKGNFSDPRYFSSYDGKRTEKIDLNNKKGEIRTCPNIVAQPAVTSEKGVVNPVRSSSAAAMKVLPSFFLRITKIHQLLSN